MTAAAPKPTPTPDPASPIFVGDRPRSKRFVLEWPIAYAGKTYEALTVRRITVAEIAAFNEARRRKDPNANLGNVVDDEGVAVPSAVLRALDGEDGDTLGETYNDFLPRSYRAEAEAEAEDESTPEPSTPTPSTTSSA